MARVPEVGHEAEEADYKRTDDSTICKVYYTNDGWFI